MSSMSLDDGGLLTQALALPDAERATIAQRLLDSLPDDYDMMLHIDPEIRDEWIAEVRRRAAEIDRGEVTTIDGEEVMRKLRERFVK